MLLFSVLALALNIKRVSKAITTQPVSSTESSLFMEDLVKQDVEKFKESYKTRTNEELEALITNPKYTKAAHEAAKQLLDQRKGNNPNKVLN